MSVSTSRSLCHSDTYPDIEVKVLICDRFDVEPNRRYRGDDLANLWTRAVSPANLKTLKRAPEPNHPGVRYLTLSLYSKVVFPALS